MAKMVISLVIEGNKEDLHTFKGNIITTACEALVSVTANEIEEPKKEIEIPKFLLNTMYGKFGNGYVDTDSVRK